MEKYFTSLEPLCILNKDGIEKIAEEKKTEVDQKIMDFIKGLKPNKDKEIFVHVLAMGDHTWGDNSNGDVFPYEELVPSNPSDESFGYKTFLKAGIYTHHRNKNPNKSLGNIVLSIFNPIMHRVELIKRVDRQLCKERDDCNIYDRLLDGELIATSMGCRVGFDQCSYCGNKAKNKDEYCDHIRNFLRKIMPNGVRVSMINRRPIFFDDSFVGVPAFKPASVISMLEEKEGMNCLGSICVVQVPKELPSEPPKKKEIQEKSSEKVQEKIASEKEKNCFLGSTQILLPDRKRVALETISPGQIVQTRFGSFPVKRVFSSQRDEGLRLTFVGIADSLYTTEEHPFLIYRRDQLCCRHNFYRTTPLKIPHKCEEFKKPIGNPAWIEAKDLRVGDFVLRPLPNHGNLKVDPDFAELVGWVASEGHLGPHGSIAFSFGKDNFEDFEAVVSCLQRLGCNPTLGVDKNTKCKTIRLSNKKLSLLLRELIVGTKREKHLTSKILEWDEDSLFRMLGAYFSGDGCIEEREKEVRGSIVSASRKMLNVLSDILLSLRIPNSIWVPKDTTGKYKIFPSGKTYLSVPCGAIYIYGKGIEKVSKFSRKKLTKIFHFKNHNQIFLNNCLLTKISKIETTTLKSSVFNLEVEEVNEFIAGEVVVHNCSPEKKVVMKTTYRELPIHIEVRAGDYKVYFSRGGKYRKRLLVHYGYIPKTTAEDGEDIDVYLKPEANKTSDIFVIKQMKQKDGVRSYDEDKVMIGFDSQHHAKAVYLQHMPEKYFGAIEKYSYADFLSKYLPKYKDHLAKEAAHIIKEAFCKCGLDCCKTAQDKESENKQADITKRVPALMTKIPHEIVSKIQNKKLCN